MTLESAVVKASKDVVDKTKNVAETALKKAWSILDAATQKERASEYLSSKAVRAIQGDTS